MLPLLIKAGKIAISSNLNDEKRSFILGCVGVRNDGSVFGAKNGAVSTSSFTDYKIIGDAHAERRVLKRLGKGGTIYTSRILKKDSSFAMARPCSGCRGWIKQAGVVKAYYSIDNNHYGIYYAELDIDKVFEV